MFLLFFESLVTLTLNVDGQRRYTTLWRAGTTEGNDDIFQNYSRTVSCVVMSAEREHNYNDLEKFQYRYNCIPQKMYGDSLKLIFVYRR